MAACMEKLPAAWLELSGLRITVYAVKTPFRELPVDVCLLKTLYMVRIAIVVP